MTTSTLSSSRTSRNSKNSENPVSSRSSAWYGRSANGRGRTFLDNAVIDATDLSRGAKLVLAILKSCAHNDTLRVKMGTPQIGKRLGLQERQTRKYTKEAVAKGWVKIHPQHNTATGRQEWNEWEILDRKKPVQVVVPPAQKCTGEGALECTPCINKSLSRNNTEILTTPPQPPEGEVVRCGATNREVRRQRNHERRQAHYREVRERRERHRCSVQQPLSAINEAAGHVMACIGVNPALRLTREAIVKSLEAWMARNTSAGYIAAARAMVEAWRCYGKVPTKFRFGPIGFFQGNHWASTDGWCIDERELRHRQMASVGTASYFEPLGYDLETQTPETRDWLEQLGYRE
jgi:hypothetical protein